MGVPHVPTYIFYDKNKALEWVKTTGFPKVFKLSKGAGSANVRLVKSKSEAEKLINTAFGKGFKPVASYFSDLSRKVKKKKTLGNIFKALLRAPKTILAKFKMNAEMNREKGYVYFQDFIPDNTFDIRIVTIGNKAVALKRLCHENDFRASGSGAILYEKDHFSDETIQLAFNISGKLQSQCMAYDFVYDQGKPLVVEISYGFAYYGYDDCPGYWDREMIWHEGKFNPYGWMVDDLIKDI